MWAAFSIDQWINIAAAFGQVAAALLAVFALILSIRTSRAQQKLAERIAGDEHAMLFEQIRNQRDSDIIKWSEGCVHTLAEIESLVAHPPDDGAERQRVALLTRLSAAIDHGRLFFPNQQPDKKGVDKPAAFQGFRQKILAVLVAAHHVLSREDVLTAGAARQTALSQLGDLRRVFISEAQLAIDPRRFIALKEMNDIRAGRGLAPQTFDGSDLAEQYRQS